MRKRILNKPIDVNCKLPKVQIQIVLYSFQLGMGFMVLEYVKCVKELLCN